MGGRSEFSRVRVHLPDLTVQLEDPSFAVSFQLPIGYGTAGDMYSRSPGCGPMGQFSVDLRGTPFVLHPAVTWRWQGHYADGSSNGRPHLQDSAYLGCFQDAVDRLLPSQQLREEAGHMTPVKCVQACRTAGFRYAGIEYGRECFCGDSLQKHGRAGKESDCSMVCTGDRNSACGGSWRLSVYDTVKGQTVSGQCGGFPGSCFPVLGNTTQPGMKLAVFPQHPCLQRPCRGDQVCVLLTAESFKCVPVCNHTWCDVSPHPVILDTADCPMGTLAISCTCSSSTCTGARFDHQRCLASTGKPRVTCLPADPGQVVLSDRQGTGTAICGHGTKIVGCSYWDPAHRHRGNGAATMATSTGTCSVSGCPGCTVYARCLAYTCGCDHGATCDPLTGRCLCPPGYYGDRCQLFDYCSYLEDHSDDHAPACAVGECQAIPRTDIRTFGGNQSDTCVFPFSVSTVNGNSHSPTSAVTYTQCVDDNLVGPPFACATHFDGEDDYVDVGTWSPGPVYTMAVWVSPEVKDSRRRIIVGAGSNCRDFGLTVRGGRFVALYTPPSSRCTADLQGPSYDVNTWHLVAVTNNGTHLALYVDGSLEGHTEVRPYHVPTMEGFSIGTTKGTVHQNFKGYIKSVKIWKRSLDIGEIESSMNTHNVSSSTSEALHQGLVAHYELGQAVNVSCQGVDHGGQDWVLLQDQEVSGVHCNVNTMTIGQGVTVKVTPYDGTNGGSFEVYAEEIHIDGYLSAEGSGYRGGRTPTGPGSNGHPGESYHNTNASGTSHVNLQAQFFQPHRGGGGGGGGTSQSSANAAPGGGGGGSAERSGGGQTGQGGQVYGTMDLDRLYLGSGGGSGGNAGDLSSTPPGGRGGNGGGSIGLHARGTVRVRGHVSVAGGDGQGDRRQATGCNVCPAACGAASSVSSCYGNSRSACWDKSGPGGGGSGGSLYIRGNLVDVGKLCWGVGARGMRVDAVTLRGQVPASCKVNVYSSTTQYEDWSVGGQQLIRYSTDLTYGNEVYLGCFEDDPGDRHFAFSVPVNSSTVRHMTPLYCRQQCRAKGYAFSGTEYSHECFCDNAANMNKRRSENDCNQPCSGDGRQICGRGYRMSVYGPKSFLPATGFNGALQLCRPWCLTGNLNSQHPNWGYCDASSQTATSFNIRCQCPSGFQGELCDQPCPQGTWGLNCLKLCICNHSNTVGCDPQDGTCDCVAGFHGDTCDLPCPAGFFGVKCAGRCTCSETADCDVVTGQCMCQAGWHGEQCNFPCPGGTWGRNCSQPCQCQQGSCDPQHGTCSCDPGYRLPFCSQQCEPYRYGPNCQWACQCHGQPCDPFTGGCRCNAGYSGDRCEKICPHGQFGKDCGQHCTCQNSASCDHVTGECLCPAGWTGLQCDRACSDLRFGPDCANQCRCVSPNTDTCDTATGLCRCKAGFTGDACQLPCPDGYFGPGCRARCTCYNNAPCDKRSGQCQCPPGVQGTQCNVTCPPGTYGTNCSSICPSCTAGFCSKNNGSCVCSSGGSCPCPQGLQGPRCDQLCQCVHGSCDSSGTCQCDPGWQGVKCDTPCAEGTYGQYCLSRCQCQHGNCSTEDGTCTCQPGYQGRLCDTPCTAGSYGEQCAGQCQACGPGSQRADCDPVNGACLCLPGYTGRQCDRPCPRNTYGKDCLQTCSCVNSACNNVDGTCECDPGYTGPTCNQECSHGFWGQGCNNTCQCSGHWTSCDLFTGDCQCAPGFSGVQCQETCSQGSWGQDCVHQCECDQTSSLCSPLDGTCQCLPGFSGPTCQPCPVGTWGVNCSQQCQCSGHGTCDSTNHGACDCDPGWHGHRCETQCEQDRKWGKDCRNDCVCSQQFCDFRFGICHCDPGKQGQHCDQPCPPGYYGLRCAQECRCRHNATCDVITGQCHCPEGLDGGGCDAGCPVGRHGEDCSLQCQCAPGTPCDPVTGQCLCSPGFMGPACNISCPEGLWDVNCAMHCPASCQKGCLPDTGQCKCTAQSCPPGYFCHTSGLCNVNPLTSKSSSTSTGCCCCHSCCVCAGMGSGQVAGVVVGVMLAAVITGIVVFLVMRRRHSTLVTRLVTLLKSDSNGQSSSGQGTDNPVYFAGNTVTTHPPAPSFLELSNAETDS
ncbi:uncharacterized protein LOC143290086 [Babylonia areolata]|uniref:uncharacterized protein LOC143290086 n=1 Tax=Babylonia areolata TaxID=304850 RepID=UPI003FCF050E